MVEFEYLNLCLIQYLLETILKNWGGSEKSSDEDVDSCSKQIDAVINFLTKKFNWNGEIFSKEDYLRKVVFKELAVSDFKMVWSYLRNVFFDIKSSPIDIPVFVIPDFKQRSFFVEKDQTQKIGNYSISGPAILLRKSNSMFVYSEHIIYQYLFNLSSLINLPETVLAKIFSPV